jgi:hypothetical protein
MAEQTQQPGINPQVQRQMPIYSYPDQIRDLTGQLHSLTKMLSSIAESLPILRRVFRGEAMMQMADGSQNWIQVVRPAFIKIDMKTGLPLKVKEKEVYIVNDEAIEEILSMLSFMGANPVTPLSHISEDNVLDDLKEFECKLAGVLALKQREWGLDKELLPMIQTKIKTFVQDIRFMACEGHTLKALQTTIQRVEQMIEGVDPRRKAVSPYG